MKNFPPSNETSALSKIMNMDIWLVGTSNQLLYEALKLKQNFRKNKVVIGKIPFFVIGSFCTPILFVLTWLLTEKFCLEMFRFHS